MTIKSVTGYVAICDVCGKTGAADDYATWEDIDGAEESVLSADWRTHDGQHWCPDCQLRCRDHTPDLIGICLRCGIETEDGDDAERFIHD